MELIIGGAYQGKYQWAISHYEEKNILNNFHLLIKEKITEGKTEEEIKQEIEREIKSNPDLVIISNEIGCGIVPFTEEDRNYREFTGRLLCKIAEQANSVYRVTCGVIQKIK